MLALGIISSSSVSDSQPSLYLETDDVFCRCDADCYAALIETIVAEANRAFDLSSEVFETLTVSSPPSQPTPESTQIAPPTPTQLTPKSGQVLFVHQPEVKGKTYPIASVIAVITALCLAHLALTLGGFTGQKGFAKLLQVEEWVFGSTSAGGSAAGNESAGF